MISSWHRFYSHFISINLHAFVLVLSIILTRKKPLSFQVINEVDLNRIKRENNKGERGIFGYI